MQASKTRTRKSTASKTKIQSQNVIPTKIADKYTELIEDNSMTEVTPPAKVRPAKTNLTYVDYIEDFKVRMEIHNFEVDELVKDLKSGYQSAKPIFNNIVDYLKQSYEKAFSSIENATTETKENALEQDS
jgi:hypothetical protein